MAAMEYLPEQVLLKILSYVPQKELVLICRLVCQQWKELVDGLNLQFPDEGLPKQNQEGKAEDWDAFYFCTSVKNNLIKNPCGEEEFSFWELTNNDGDGWKIEDLPGDNGKPFPNEHIQKYFVTSFDWCQKSQLINLVSEGFEAETLDNAQPPITVRDWYAGRHDSGFDYELHVELLSEDMSMIQEYRSDKIHEPQWGDAEWKEISNIFTNYGPGVRNVKFTHGGKDSQCWAGWYGARITNSAVTVEQ
ncbi:F-box only protein 2-like [Scyliorhinus canicula]|uniref:F-box only protein 2-like n=1 Tax=Scyliorhinus canicula TaxID=7830 RepID=UPI0018F6F445|nr:F-box only protein 2-like [Scyliorhinus canicula]XP_038629374.1 F-box only protein 2-like [Scyliorhinus canicula]